MVLIQRITLELMRLNISLLAEFISSEDNYFADLLSRGQQELFLEKLPKFNSGEVADAS